MALNSPHLVRIYVAPCHNLCTQWSVGVCTEIQRDVYCETKVMSAAVK